LKRAPFFNRREEPRAIRASSTQCSISDDRPLPQGLVPNPRDRQRLQPQRHARCAEAPDAVVQGLFARAPHRASRSRLPGHPSAWMIFPRKYSGTFGVRVVPLSVNFPDKMRNGTPRALINSD